MDDLDFELELTNQEYLFSYYEQHKITVEHRGRMMDNLSKIREFGNKLQKLRADLLIIKHKIKLM